MLVPRQEYSRELKLAAMREIDSGKGMAEVARMYQLSPKHRRPHIRFLFIGSCLCSTLLSGPASRRVLFRPCASLTLRLHQTG